MMLYLKDNKINAYCLLGNTKSSADYRAAAELVKAIEKLTVLKIDVKPLMKEAKILEDALMKHLKTLEVQKQGDEGNSVASTLNTKVPMYT
jgi:predicted ATP-grasp superfamily ATP-dependent carboligase